MVFFKFLSELLNLYGDFKKSIYNDISEQQKYNNKQGILKKQFKFISISHKRNEIRKIWAEMDKTLAPVASIRYNLLEFFPPDKAFPNDYKYFISRNNMSIGRKYVKLTYKCRTQLLSEKVADDFIIYNKSKIRDSLQYCINDVNYLWHILKVQFPLMNKQGGLVSEVHNLYKDKGTIQVAFNNLNKYSKLLQKHIGQLNKNFAKAVK